MVQRTQNLLINSLSPESRNLLLSSMTEVRLSVRAQIYAAEETPQHCFFPNSGMISIVTSMRDGATAEVGVMGREGASGCLHLLGPGKIATDSFVQLEGTAMRIAFPHMRQVFRDSEEIRSRILELVQEQSVCAHQIAGCNRLHEAEERLARWLLMAQDRTQRDVLTFTQEFLGMMLGARRSTVTVIAGILQRAGLIEYERGHVRIVDRPRLEQAACDCYPIMRDLYKNLYGGFPSSSVVPALVRGNGAPRAREAEASPSVGATNLGGGSW